MLRVVLIGFRGTGKSESGRRLAQMTGREFIDTDIAIEKRTGRRIHDIFTDQGEPVFRDLERNVISCLPDTDSVVAAGGGAVLDPRNVENLRRGSLVFLLEAGIKSIESRIAGSERPPLTKLPLREEISSLLRERRPYYVSAADFCVNTDTKDANEVALEIRRICDGEPPGLPAHETGVGFIAGTGIPRDELQALEQAVLPPGGDPTIRIYAIAGHPCGHSKSPALFNRLFAHYGIHGHYTRICWPDITEIVRHARDMSFRGLSVTIPFKMAVIPLIDKVDKDAERIGAVNTVVFCGYDATGYNTDWLGIREPLQHRKGARGVVIGAGGAAASAVYALLSLDMEVTILNRTVKRGSELAARFGCGSAEMQRFSEIAPDVVVNATPVGMAPDTGIPVDPASISRDMTVLDMVYTPEETPLIRASRAVGAEVIVGTEIFAGQARAQFRRFTGIATSAEVIRRMLS
ncbi:MAG: shikimate dehydrogenase [Methanoregulaceae archaeon]|nr:shikimate dehydrogenase [Methanoregulaceae archaeon]